MAKIDILFITEASTLKALVNIVFDRFKKNKTELPGSDLLSEYVHVGAIN